MRRTILSIVLLLAAATFAKAQTATLEIIEDGGTGPYKACMTTYEGLDGYAIYRPMDLPAAVKAEKKALPVIIFGNSGCALASRYFYNFLCEIASYGYVIVAHEEPGEEVRYVQGVMEKYGDTMMDAREISAFGLLTALDFLQAESRRKGSELYKKINCKQVSAMGQSCGGLQAIACAVTGDKRIKAMTMLNSGVLPSQGPFVGFVDREELAVIKVPMGYFEGGKGDMAYTNGWDDYQWINHTPVVFASYDAGHMGTYIESHGGTFGVMVRNWLDFALKGKKYSKNTFVNADPTGFDGWTILSKNF